MRHLCVLVTLGVTLLGSCLQTAAAPADHIANPHFALKFKGEDTAVSACQYYKAIGAVGDCGPAGELIAPSFNFAEWKRRNGLAVNPDVDSDGTAFGLIDQTVNWLTRGEASALYLLSRAQRSKLNFPAKVENRPKVSTPGAKVSRLQNSP
jgi:hypothetical protein